MEFEKWPDYTCVLAFVYHSLRKLGKNIDLQELSNYLDIQVLEDSHNPFKFQVSKNDPGLSLDKVKVQLPMIFQRYAPDHNFLFVGLNTVPFEMYEEFIEESLRKGLIVGVGYDFSIVSGKKDQAKHVSFLQKLFDKKALLTDYYIHTRGYEIEIVLADLIKNMRKIGDGFWLVGNSNDLKSDIV